MRFPILHFVKLILFALPRPHSRIDKPVGFRLEAMYNHHQFSIIDNMQVMGDVGGGRPCNDHDIDRDRMNIFGSAVSLWLQHVLKVDWRQRSIVDRL